MAEKLVVDGTSSLIVFTAAIWSKVYDALGDAFDSSAGGLWVEPTPDFWDVYVPKDLTPNRVLEAMRPLGIAVETHDVDLDAETAGRHERDPARGPYRIRFRARVEADEENKSLSADDCDKQGIQGPTLPERLLLGLAHFIATEDQGDDLDARHLDRDKVTLCAGSRGSDGDVPGVSWNRGNRKIYVYWYGPMDRDAFLRARSAVSLKT